MPIFAIAYHFHEDGTAAARRDSLVREVGRCARVWSETPALALVETAEPLAGLEARLYLDSTLNSVKDRLLVIELADATAAMRGAIAEPDVLSAMLPGIAIA